MPIHAFKDSADGYYQVEVPAGMEAPTWCASLIPCAVIPVAPVVLPAQSQIDEIERKSQMNRAIREFFLLTAEEKATERGLTKAQLYAANISYRKIKDIDNQIAILRGQI